MELEFEGKLKIPCPVQHDESDDEQMVMHPCQQGLIWPDMPYDKATVKMLLAQLCYCKNKDYGCWATPTWRKLPVTAN